MDVYVWMFPKIVVPPKSSISIGFSTLNHPFWGFSPIFGKHPFMVQWSDHSDMWWLVSVGASQVKLQKSVATNSEVIKTLAPGEAVQATGNAWKMGWKDERFMVFHGGNHVKIIATRTTNNRYYDKIRTSTTSTAAQKPFYHFQFYKLTSKNTGFSSTYNPWINLEQGGSYEIHHHLQVSETKEEAQQASVRVRVRTLDGPEALNSLNDRMACGTWMTFHIPVYFHANRYQWYYPLLSLSCPLYLNLHAYIDIWKIYQSLW